MASSAFVDTNVLMEILFARLRMQAAIEALDAESELATSILSLSTTFYYVERDNYSKAATHAFFKGYQILDMNEADYNWAAQNDQGDFEDALQVACAMRHGCKKLITLDADLAKRHNKHIAVKLVK
jgi:predicted nucleic acid-binding protein